MAAASEYDRSRLTKLLQRPDVRAAVASGGSVAKLPSVSEYDRELLAKHGPALRGAMRSARTSPERGARSQGRSR